MSGTGENTGSARLDIDCKGTPQWNVVKNTRHGVMMFNKNDLYVGRSLDLYGEYGEGQTEIMRQMVKPRDVIVDVGAFIGTMTLFLAQAVGPAGTVLAFEPQRMPYQALCGNIALNSLNNVFCFHAALGAERGTTTVPPLDYSIENNFGALGLYGFDNGERVNVITLDDVELPKCDVIKVNVEGMESDVLKGAKSTIENYLPHIYMSATHDDKLGPAIEMLLGLGYRLFWDVSNLFSAVNFYDMQDDVFEGTVLANVVCLPPTNTIDVDDGHQITAPGQSWRSLAPGSTAGA